MEVGKSLLQKRKAITEFLYQHAEELASIRKRTQAVPSIDWVLEFAENITPTLRAPDEWVPGRPLHDLCGHPPAPQFEQMRLGRLGQLHQSRVADFSSLAPAVQIGLPADMMLDDAGLLTVPGPGPVTTATITNSIESGGGGGGGGNGPAPPEIKREGEKRSRQLNINFGLSSGDDESGEDE